MINWIQLSVIALLIVAVSADTQEAICILQPTADATTPVSGVVTFKNISSDPAVPIQITLVASGLPPNANLGFHVHQFGYIGTTNGLGT
jgi:Cu/Zn superoxide dismutase